MSVAAASSTATIAMVNPIAFSPLLCACSAPSFSSSTFISLSLLIFSNGKPYDTFNGCLASIAMQELESLLGPSMAWDIVILQNADGAVNFQHGQCGIVDAADAMLAQCAIEFIHRDMFFCHVRGDAFAVMD